MEILTKKEVIKNVARVWKAQYPIDRSTMGCKSTDEVWEKLKKGDLSEQGINDLIGNNSWTANDCNECGEDSEVVVIFPCGDDNDVRICSDCLKEALRRIEEENL